MEADGGGGILAAAEESGGGRFAQRRLNILPISTTVGRDYWGVAVAVERCRQHLAARGHSRPTRIIIFAALPEGRGSAGGNVSTPYQLFGRKPKVPSAGRARDGTLSEEASVLDAVTAGNSR